MASSNLPRWIPWAVVGLLAVGVMAYLLLPRGYGKVSPEAYEYAIALYAACNQRDADKVATLQSMITDAREQGQIAPREHRWLTNILNQAERGNWQKAQQQSLRLLEDQVDR